MACCLIITAISYLKKINLNIICVLRPSVPQTLFLIILLLLIPIGLFSQEDTDITRREIEEDPAEFMSLSLRDSEVSLFITGTWKGTLQGNIGIGFSPLGRAFKAPESPFLFTQEADLLLSLWINNKWFVEANIQDESSQNTYRAGFHGGPGDFVQYAGIGNTGLDFPAFPYLDLGGDSFSSFGYYGRMGTSSLSIHSLFRYDTALREEKIFSGSRERTVSFVEPQNYIRGVSFVLPEENITGDFSVFIEDETGTLQDESGRRWRLALHSEYAAGRREGILEIGIRPEGMVAVYYPDVGSNLGSYSGEGFLKEVQDYFGSLNLSSLGEPSFVNINGVNALILYQTGRFSPFEKLSRYDAPSSTSEQASVIRLSTGAVRNDFELMELSSVFLDIPLYMQAESSRSVYELHPANRALAREPASRWPLASEHPGIYLPVTNNYSGDTILRFVNYSVTSGYFIGADVVEGSVQVFRSGIQDSNFRFNASTGEVALFAPAGSNEIIRITYLKKSEEANLGSIAAGLGAEYQKEGSPFGAQAAIGVRWNLTDSNAFTEEGTPSLGTVGVSAKTTWDYYFGGIEETPVSNLRAHIAAGFTYENKDTTGLYRAAGMEGNEVIINLPSEESFLSHPPAGNFDLSNRADLIYRNYYNQSVIGSNLMPVSWNGAVRVEGINKPYPVKDPLMGDSQLMAADFILGANQWTGFESPLGYTQDFISRAQEILIPYRLYEIDHSSRANLKVIIQIGSLSSRDFAIHENPDLIWEKELDINQVDADGRHIAIFTLNHTDHLKLAGANHLRLLIINEDWEAVTGRVLLAPPIARGSSFKPVILENDTVKGIQDSLLNNVLVYETMETQMPVLETAFPEIIKRLHPGDNIQRVLKIEWNNMQQGISAGADSRITGLPLNDYRKLSFFVKAPGEDFEASDEKIRFIIAASPDSLNSPVLQALIPIKELPSRTWSRITIRYNDDAKSLFINGNKIEDVDITYNPLNFNIHDASHTLGASVSYIAFFVDPRDQASSLKDADIYIDEIILEDPITLYRMNAGASLEFTRDGTMLSLGNISAVSDFRIAAMAESEISFDYQDENKSNAGSVVNRTGMSVSVFGARVEANTAFIAADNSITWSADHAVSKSIKDFSVKENFFAYPSDNNVRHLINMSYMSDFHAKAEAEAVYEFFKLNQNWNIGTGYKPKNELIPSISFGSSFSWIKNKKINENDNYALLWVNTLQPLLPDTGKEALNRDTESQIIINQRTMPVGAVFTLKNGTQYKDINNIINLYNSMLLDIPVAVRSLNFNFSMGRQYKKHINILNYEAIDVIDDIDKLFESIREASGFWTTVPIYSLFTSGLNDKMDNILNNSADKNYNLLNSFNDHFAVSLNLKGKNNFSSFFIPVRTDFRLERMLDQKMDTRADILNLRVSLSFSAINMFGSMGYKPVFNFYRTDEFNHSVQAAIAFNNDEDILWRIQSNLGTGFRTAKGTVSFTNILTLRNSNYFTESIAIDWTTQANKSLTGLIYTKIANAISIRESWPALSSLLSQEYEQLRKESIELVIDGSDDYLKWRLILGHEEIVRIFGRLELAGFTKLRFTEDKFIESLVADFLFGTSLRIQF